MKALSLLATALILSSCKSDESATNNEESNEDPSFRTLEMLSESEEQAKETQEQINKRVENAKDLMSILDKHPTAKPVPGRPGYVFNPYTNQIVDVRGLPPGQLVRDPADPVPNRQFRTPNP